MNIPINEIFYSLQGEGSHTGSPMVFIRFAGCNLSCSFCDQPDSVPISPEKLKFTKMSVQKILDIVQTFPTKTICFTGGEPTLFPHEMLTIMSHLPEHQFHIETNGTHYSPEVFSKLFHISMAPHVQVDSRVWQYAKDIKILMDEHFEENLNTAKRYKDLGKVIWIQPINDHDQVNKPNLKKAIDTVLLYPWTRLSPQFHKFLEVK